MKDIFVTTIVYCIALVCSLIHANFYRKELVTKKIIDNILISLRLLAPFVIFSFIFQSFGVSALYGYSIIAVILFALLGSIFWFPSLLCISILVIFYQWTFWFPERKYLILHPKSSETEHDERLDCLIGQTGKAVTDLKPEGKVLIADKEYQARCQDGFLSSNNLIKVVNTYAFGLVVRKLTKE